MKIPIISVIIPTYHRNDLLAKCLDCLAPGSQTLPAEKYEVIVTDDSSQTTAKEMIDQYYPWSKWVAGPRKGPAANRNNGARYAQGQWLVFTDDDCLPTPYWLQAYVEAINSSASALEGSIHPIGDPNQDLAECPVNLTGGNFWSANIFVKRLLFEEIGGFDPNIRGANFEDMDIFIRLAQKTKVIFVHKAKVFHPVRIRSLQKRIAYTVTWSKDWAYFVSKHQKVRGYTQTSHFITKPYKIHLYHFLNNIRQKYFKNACHELINLFFGIPLFWMHLFYLNKTSNNIPK